MMLRAAHAALYVPLLLLISSWVFKAAYVLAHGMAAGVYVLPYAIALWFLARRARRAWRGEIERAGLDAALVGAAAALWLFLFYAQFL